MIIQKPWIVALLLMLCQLPICFGTTHAPPAIKHRITLNDAVMLALRENPNVRIAYLQRVVDKFNLRAAEYDFEPQYKLTGNIRRDIPAAGDPTTTQDINQSTTLLTPIGTELGLDLNAPSTDGAYSPNAMISVKQPLIKGFGSSIVQTDLLNAQDQEKINKLTLRDTIISTITQVVLAYRTYIQDLQQFQIAKESVVGYRQTIRQNKALIKAGRMAPAQLTQAKARLAEAIVTVDTEENSVEQDHLNLIDLLGLDPRFNFTIVPAIDLGKRPDYKQDESIQLALANDESYQQARLQVTIDERQLARDQNNELWTLDASVRSTYEFGDHGSSSLDNNTLELELSIPIDDFTLRQAVINDKITVRQDKINLQERKFEVIKNVMSSLAELRIIYRRALNAHTATQLQKQTYEQAKIELRYGRTTNFELLSQQRDYNETLAAEVAAEIAYLNALTNFRETLGTTLDHWKIKVRY